MLSGVASYHHARANDAVTESSIVCQEDRGGSSSAAGALVTSETGAMEAFPGGADLLKMKTFRYLFSEVRHLPHKFC